VLLSSKEKYNRRIVLITGIGSGVAQLAAQMAVLIEAEVWITTSSEKRIEAAIQKFGVKGGFNYRVKDWTQSIRKTVGEFELIIDGTGGSDFNAILNLLKVGGKMVVYGATAGNIGKNFSIHNIFLLHKQIIGTSMGSDTDFQELVHFINLHKMKPSLDSVVPFVDFLAAFHKMKHGDQFGKIVLAVEENSRL